MKRLILPAVVMPALVACLAMVWSLRHVSAQQDKSITVTRIYTGPDGLTHAEKIDVKLNRSRSGPARSDPEKATNVSFNRIPAGLYEDWHRAPKGGRYVITISGRVELDIANGEEKVVLGPGSILLADDTTGKGHTARVGPDEDWVTIFVPLPEK